ncbi:hypothetical protein KSS87_022165 [Heliosperma pusillum]|nr:hypothetical protein KSS87_022165 [Heliosperma pusillum]
MDVDMDTSPSYYDPQDISIREQYRRYGKRQSSPSTSPLHNSSGRRSNTALFLEDIKQEVESQSYREGTPSRTHSAYKQRSHDGQAVPDFDSVVHSSRWTGNYSLKACKIEEDDLDSDEATFTLFASLLDSACQGLISIPELILQFEKSCRDVSESIRYGPSERHRIIEDRLIRQKAQLLLDEAASWSLLWYIYGKGNEEIPADLVLKPTTSHLEVCKFVAKDKDVTAQLCLRMIQWLEGLASKALDLESKKQDESLLEDIWTLLRAGRLEEACELCRSAGQPWRAACLCPFGGLDLLPSVEALSKNDKARTLQALELESGLGRQWRLWKWASYSASERIGEQGGGKYEAAVFAAQCSNLKRMLPICTDWESACWAMAKSWLDVQMDMYLAQLQPGRMELLKNYEEATGGSLGQGSSSAILGKPENWPLQVQNQQPRHLSSLFQKLHSSDLVNEAVIRECKEQHRQIEASNFISYIYWFTEQMNLMSGDIPRLLELVWSWISPSDDDQNAFRPHGEPHMLRFGAHLVLVLRLLLEDDLEGAAKEKIMNVGDLILHIYAMYLFSQQHEELVGIYASHLARHRCIDLFVNMMELRLNASVHVKFKLFLSAVEYLPFSPNDNSSGSFEEIIERILSRSREIKPGKYNDSEDVAEQHRLQSLDKAMVIQWLCFTPPSTIDDVEAVSAKLLLQSLIHSNILFREFALISMWRVPDMPLGAHELLGFLAEPLKQPTENLMGLEGHDVPDLIKEFKDWSEYYSCDATYRNWLKIQLENAEVSPSELSTEEKDKAIFAAKETLNSSLLLLQRKESPWLVPTEDQVYNSPEEPLYLELYATAILCLSSGECMSPDATLCATLMSALYSSVSEEVAVDRELTVDVKMCAKDNFSVEVILRCQAVEGDGLGHHEHSDGGILASVIASGFKGELPRFQAGVTMEISRLDACYFVHGDTSKHPATYVVRGLCRRCCLPELALRCMQASVTLVELDELPERHDELIELVACPETGFLHLFSQQQLQEFLLFEREYSVCFMELQEEHSAGAHELLN